MAPFNLENNIREKLENRELTPSSSAWEKLETQLNEHQPRKKSVGWYYLAASVAAILIVTSVFLNQKTIEVQDNVATEIIEKKATNQLQTKIASEQANSVEDKKALEETKTGNKPKQGSKELKPLPPKKESAIDKKIKKSELLADVSRSQNQDNPKNPLVDVNLNQSKVFNEKVNEVVASVKALQEKNNDVTVNEVETLLNDARRDIQTQQILNNPKVDATALLQDVEWELDKNFRDKVFDALGDGFNKIRTAVLERND